MLNNNFDASTRIDGGIFATDSRRLNMKTGDLIQNAKFKNPGISAVLEGMSVTLRERYTSRPEPVGGKELLVWKFNDEYRLETLEELKDPQWLEKLLRRFLDDQKIDWRTEGHRHSPEISTSRQASKR
ncbi:hypothetical protein C0991_002012, partial [Blastosporella zonata]